MLHGKDGRWREQPLDRWAYPNTVVRRCTDFTCAVVFVCFLLAFGLVLLYAAQYGDPRHYFGLPDADGNVCGISAGYTDVPYLYFCQGEATPLTVHNTVCVRGCSAEGIDPYQSSCKHGSGASYPTRPWGGMLCLPAPGDARSSDLMHQVTKNFWSHSSVAVFLELSQVVRAWQPIVAAMCVALVLGFLYTLVMRKMVLAFVRFCLVMMVAVPCVLGVSMLYCGLTTGADQIRHTGDGRYNLVAGCVLLVVSALVFCVAATGQGGVKMAQACIRAASEVIRGSPSMLAEPFLLLAARVLTGLILTAGLLWLISTTIVYDFNALAFQYNGFAACLIAFYVFTACWLMEFWACLSSFALAYSTELWYFTAWEPLLGGKNVPRNIVYKALRLGIRYHLGTMAYGSGVITLTRGPRAVLGFIAQASREADSPIGQCLGEACAFCNDAYDRWLRYFSKSAYMDVAINSNSFCKAAYHAEYVLSSQAPQISGQGATSIVTFTAASSIAAVGSVIAYMSCRLDSRFNDPASKSFVEDPLFIAMVAAAACLVVAMPFVQIFNDVADALLFCFAIETKRYPLGTGIKNEARACTRGARSCMLGTSDKSDRASCMYSSTLGGSKVTQVHSYMNQPPETQALLGVAQTKG